MADENQTPAPTPPVNPTPAPAAAPAQAGVSYGGFWIRFAAAFIDGIILGVIRAPLQAITGGNQTGSTSSSLTGTATLLSLLIGVVYYALMESSSWQATVGKKALGLKVTDLNGNRISKGTAFGREFAKILSAIILGIGYIMAAFDSRKQALHDKIAKTLVVKTK